MSFDQDLIFIARSPNGHEYKIFKDGTHEGFPDGTRLFNYWLPVYQSEQALREKATKQSNVISK